VKQNANMTSQSALIAPIKDGAISSIVAEWKRSWRPGVASLVGSAVAFSVWPTVSSLFIQPLQGAFGWSRGDISFAFNAGLISAFAAPVIGRMVDRLGVRPVLITGLVLTALCYVLFALMTGSLVSYYALYFTFTIVGMCTTGITYTRVITGAFHDTRGSALAISRSGLALSGALLPILLFATIAQWGLAGGFLTLAALILLVALPLAWLWIPARRNEVRHPKAMHTGQSDSWRVLLRKPKVLLICLASALNYAPVVALMTQMMPLAQSKGMTPELAVGAVSAIGIAAVAGALLSGLLVDRIWAPIVACVFNIVPAAGCLLLLPDNVAPWMLYASVLMIGLGQGAEIDIVAYMIARYFGLRSYATIYGLSVLAIALSVAVAASAIGQAYDLFGSYNIPLMCAAASFALAAVSYLLMGRYPRHHPDGPHGG
jgi:predicted MFS family arabinose efflux permease